jgi:hypothetical protein
MKTFILCSSILLFATLACADNCSGKWVLERPGRGGRGSSTVLILNQTGETLRGTIAGGNNASAGSAVSTEIYGGKVEGDTISFYIWQGSDKPWKEHFEGKLSGDEIVFTITSDRPQSQQNGRGQSATAVSATAKRSQ